MKKKLYKILKSGKITCVNNENFQEKEDYNEDVHFEKEIRLLDEYNYDNDSEDIENTNDDIYVDINTTNEFVEDDDVLIYFVVQT